MITRREFSMMAGGLVMVALAGCSNQGETNENAAANANANTNANANANANASGAALVAAASPVIRLNSGFDMPILGHGTWTLTGDTAENAVYTAIASGYRLIDTAQIYGNEDRVGAGINRAIADGLVTREDLFVTSKISPANAAARPAESIDESLQTMGLDYLDLMLLHEPGTNDSGAYHALEAAAAAGKVRSIGISNFYTPQALDQVLSYATVVPAIIQNENHLRYQNTTLQAAASEHDIIIESWYPYGGRDHVSEILADDTVNTFARAHGKTAAQIIARWQTQAGYIAIPGSGNAAHIAENIAIFDFELSEDEMAAIAALDEQHRFENW